jgi:hypothetical protein
MPYNWKYISNLLNEVKRYKSYLEGRNTKQLKLLMTLLVVTLHFSTIFSKRMLLNEVRLTNATVVDDASHNSV